MGFEDEVLASTAKARQLQQEHEVARQGEEEKKAAEDAEAESNKARLTEFGQLAARMLMQADVPTVTIWDEVPFGEMQFEKNDFYPGGINAFRINSLEPVGQGWHVLTTITPGGYETEPRFEYYSVSTEGELGSTMASEILFRQYTNPRTGKAMDIKGIIYPHEYRTGWVNWAYIIDEGDLVKNALAYKIATGHEFIHNLEA